MDWETMPPVSEPHARLKEYRRRKKAEHQLWELNRVKFKRDLGEELTPEEQHTLDQEKWA